jgi:predicted dehydrogenase
MAEAYGFARAYADIGEMLRAERPDGCIAVTPIPVTVEVAEQVVGAGIPLLMEKPPGATASEARHLVELAQRTGARVMVSMNRRFDPAIRAAKRWWGARPIHYIRGSIARVGRTEPDFAYGTAIHPLDTMRAILGEIKSYDIDTRVVGNVSWYVVHLEFAAGGRGTLEVLPTAGVHGESYSWCGDGAYVEVRVGERDAGTARGWEAGVLQLVHCTPEGEPVYVRNGTYDETAAFVAALTTDAMMYPSPADVLQSVEICQAMLEQRYGDER